MPLTKRRLVFISLLLLAFLFRLAFGLCSQFVDADTKQIYLLGLKFYTTGAWPYFGPDVVWGEIQIPGALQALLVGGPFFILPLAEAPYLLLNLLSFTALCLLAWYCCKRLPDLPRWFVWSWLLTAPWLLDLSTTIYNPSYVLFGSILFFVGALEIYPFTSKQIISTWTANFMMGFGLCWVMQLHLSWPVLVPYALVALYFQTRQGIGAFVRGLGWFALGALVTGSLLLPTYLKYGFGEGAGGTTSAITLNSENITALWGILTRLLSFASFEVPRLLGPHTAERIAFLKAERWLIPFAAFLFVVGTAQVIALIVSWFLRDPRPGDWKAIKYLLLGNVLIVYASFLFSIKPPQSNHLYVTLPIPMIYSLYCWNRLLQSRRWQMFGKIFITCGIIFHVGLAASNLRNVSIYLERDKIVEAIRAKDYRLLGERRAGARY
ncbi:MAG TPA: hypothetical protein VGW76_02390 [Pyrinomonadaceae bacterium]|nr:hypothetical protein [Pyrinomonadaceae bacterium]